MLLHPSFKNNLDLKRSQRLINTATHLLLREYGTLRKYHINIIIIRIAQIWLRVLNHWL